MGLYRTEAIVVGHKDLGEADKILTLFSPDKGIIRAVARGARRPRNRLLGASQMFTYGKYLIMQGRNLDNISQNGIIESFYKIRSNLEQMAYGLYFAELLRASTPIEDKNRELFSFFLKTLYMLQEWKDLEFLCRIYELKLLAIQGFLPELFRCVSCGNSDGYIYFFSITLGGILCDECKLQDRKAILLNEKVLYVLRKILLSTYEELENFYIDDVRFQLKKILHLFILHQFDHEFKTVGFIKDIKKLNNVEDKYT